MSDPISYLTEPSPGRFAAQPGLVESFSRGAALLGSFTFFGFIRGTVRQRPAPAASHAQGEPRRGMGIERDANRE